MWLERLFPSVLALRARVLELESDRARLQDEAIRWRGRCEALESDLRNVFVRQQELLTGLLTRPPAEPTEPVYSRVLRGHELVRQQNQRTLLKLRDLLSPPNGESDVGDAAGVATPE